MRTADAASRPVLLVEHEHPAGLMATVARPPGTPLGLLLRPPYEPAKRGGARIKADAGGGDDPWQWSLARHPTPWTRARATAKLCALAVTLAGVLAPALIAAAGGLLWGLAHLAATGPHH